MKHGIRAFCRLSLAASLVLAVAIWHRPAGALDADAAQGGDAIRHITGAGFLERPGEAPHRTVEDAAALAGDWAAVVLPHVARAQLIPEGKHPPRITLWYRIDLEGVPVPPHDTLELYLVRWQTPGQLTLYVDGRAAFHSQGSPAWNEFTHPAILLPLTHVPGAPAPREVLIRVDTAAGAGSALSSLYVGPSATILARYSARQWWEYQLPFISSVAFVAIGLFPLAVWIRRRRETLYLIFFLMGVCTAVRRWHFYAGLERLPISDAWFGWITYNALNWQVIVLYHFLTALHGRRRPWLNRVLIAIAGTLTVLTLPFGTLLPALVLIKPFLYLFIIAAFTVMTAIAVWDGWRARSRDALILAAWQIIGLAFGIRDWLELQWQFDVEGFFLTPYVGVGNFVLFVVFLFLRHVRGLQSVEAFNLTLTRRLREREAELAASYERLRAAEQREMVARERQRIMQDIHDGLGSSLVSALRVVERGRMSVQDVAQVLQSCIDDLKLTIDLMGDVEADLLLVLATLRFRLGPRLEAMGVGLLWEVGEVPGLDWLDQRNTLHILRILQEVFTNIIKHTRATEIRVATAAGPDGVVVTVIDNGPGFAVEQALAGGGRGLANQRRRAEEIGGSIRWEADAGGTKVMLWLPIRR